MKEGLGPKTKTLAMQGMAFTLSHPSVYKYAGKMGRWVMKQFPFAVNNKINAWFKNREMPEPPKQSFGEWYKENRKRDL